MLRGMGPAVMLNNALTAGLSATDVTLSALSAYGLLPIF